MTMMTTALPHAFRNGTDRPWPRTAPPLSDDALLRDYLARHDCPCPACAYNLRGIRLDRCPECGMPLHLAVRGLDDSSGPQLVRLLAAAMPLGFNAIFMSIGVIGAVFSRSWRSDDWVMLSVFGVLSVVFGFLLRRVIRTSARFRRRPRRRQRRIAMRWALATGLLQAVALALMFVLR